MTQAQISEPQGAVNVHVLVKGEERYIVMYADEQRAKALLKVGQWACHPDLSLDWKDCVTLMWEMRKRTDEVCSGK